ncbi:XdhC family protein [Plantactinospora sp. WMMB334]|uniref:XdhC family protein n=1 Tax=Plantactinospora sp. WMMB334 TaxID=3404119 RepID=UPI003B932205
MLREVWPFVQRKRSAGERVVLVRLIRRNGRASRPLGATMAVASDGSWTGSVSGGCVEGVLLEQAREVLDGAPPRRAVIRPGEDLLPWEPAPVCDGELDLLIGPAPEGSVYDDITRALAEDRPLRLSIERREPFRWATAAHGTRLPAYEEQFVEELQPRAVLLLVGATDLAAVVAEMAVPLGRRVVVVDPRPEYARPERVPAAHETIQAWPDGWLAEFPLGSRDAVLVLTHDPRIDDRAIRAALAGAAGYVGVLGSHRTHARRLARLDRTPGLDRLVGPAGLNVGGTSLAETALSMLAEIVAVAHRRTGGRLQEWHGGIQADDGTRVESPRTDDPPPGAHIPMGPLTTSSCPTCVARV